MDRLQNNQQVQRVDLTAPMTAVRPGPAPLLIRAIVMSARGGMVEGVPASAQQHETYVLLSALPAELRGRVTLAVQALIAGM